jgi:hypothetical protein
MSIIIKVLQWFAKGGPAAFLIHAGLSVAVFSGLDIIAEGALEQAVSALNGLPSDALGLALLAGVDDFFSIIGSAILTKIALNTAMSSMSLKRSNK